MVVGCHARVGASCKEADSTKLLFHPAYAFLKGRGSNGEVIESSFHLREPSPKSCADPGRFASRCGQAAPFGSIAQLGSRSLTAWYGQHPASVRQASFDGHSAWICTVQLTWLSGAAGPCSAKLGSYPTDAGRVLGDVRQVITQVTPLLGGRLFCNRQAWAPFRCGTDRTWHEPAAAVRAHIKKSVVGTIGTERTFVGANSRFRRAGWQVLVAKLAVRSQF